MKAVQVKACERDGRLRFVVMVEGDDGELYDVEWSPGASSGSPVHEALARVLSSLDASDPLVRPLLRADDARSGFVALRRWAWALAERAGVEPHAYASAVCSVASNGASHTSAHDRDHV